MKEIAGYLLKIGAVFLRPEQPFTWASGIKSPIYCDNRLVLTDVEARDAVENAISETVRRRYPQAQALFGTSTAGIAHCAIAAHILRLPAGYVRSGAKEHGRTNRIEGKLEKGEKVVVIEDLISTGGSVIEVVEALREAGAEDATQAARELVCTASGKTKNELLRDGLLYASPEVERSAYSLCARHLAGEPVAYLIGEWEFYGLPLRVTPDVLIPRDDTCAVAELAIRKALFLEQDPRILDLCCGSGCIGLAIASRVKDAKVTLADLSMEALAIAKENTGLNRLGGRVRCVQADATKKAPAFLGKYDMIVSNPPYVTGAEMQALPHSVRDFEPAMALYGGEDGLDFYRAIVENYTPALKKGGFVCFEFGMGQGDDVCRILEENGYTILERTRDYNDRERAVLAQYGRKED